MPSPWPWPSGGISSRARGFWYTVIKHLLCRSWPNALPRASIWCSGLLTSHVWHAAQFQPLFATHPQGWQWNSWHPFEIQPWAILAAHTKCRLHHDAIGPPLLTSRQAHWARATITAHPLPHILWPSLIQIVYSLTGSRIPSFQPHFCPLVGAWPLTQLCLSAHSKVLQGMQQSTCKVYGHA